MPRRSEMKFNELPPLHIDKVSSSKSLSAACSASWRLKSSASTKLKSRDGFHMETFGWESLAPSEDGTVLEAFVAEVTL
jgi:hypothetical protein